MRGFPPVAIDELREAVLSALDELSPRLQQVARHFINEPNDLAFETLATVAAKIGVQASTIVRFAQRFGFDGAMPMQRMLRDALLRQSGSIGYTERLRQFSRSLPGTAMADPSQLLGEFVEGSIHALENLPHLISARDLVTAIDMIERADTVFLLGFRRAFPVATYFTYLLAQAGKRVVLVDGVAGLAALQVQSANSDDLVIAISFAPYAPEVVELVEVLNDLRTPIFAISDSAISPIAKKAALVLQVRETDVRGFRSIAASMSLVQTLAIYYGLTNQRTATL